MILPLLVFPGPFQVFIKPVENLWVMILGLGIMQGLAMSLLNKIFDCLEVNLPGKNTLAYFVAATETKTKVCVYTWTLFETRI